jgi:hypothetical protein
MLTALIAIIQVLKPKRKAFISSWFLIFFAVVCIFFGLEEIRWGQRIFGLESPDFFVSHSDQQEINLHNVVSEQLTVRTKQIAAWVLFGYGVVLPILALSPAVHSFSRKFHIVIPSKVLLSGFLLACLMTWDRFFTGQDEEVAELFFSILLFLTLAFNFWKLNENHDSEILINKGNRI